jgi:hypothetical protein
MAEYTVPMSGEEITAATEKSKDGKPLIRITHQPSGVSFTGSLMDVANLRAKLAALLNVSDGSRIDSD